MLESHVLDLIHLDEGHSGAATGKLMFQSLLEYDAATKMSINALHLIYYRIAYLFSAFTCQQMLPTTLAATTFTTAPCQNVDGRPLRQSHLTLTSMTSGVLATRFT